MAGRVSLIVKGIVKSRALSAQLPNSTRLRQSNDKYSKSQAGHKSCIVIYAIGTINISGYESNRDAY